MSKSKNIALLLPLFYEYARNIRKGVIDWIDQNPGWRIIELDPLTAEIPPDLKKHFDGIITWCFPQHRTASDLPELNLYRIDCGGYINDLLDDPMVAGITYERLSMVQLSIDHFRHLGIEAIGHVGTELKNSPVHNESTQLFTELAAKNNMNYDIFELHEYDPANKQQLIWQGKTIPGLEDFLRAQPKPLGLFATDDYVGVMLCQTALQMGYRIPDDIVVLGQGNRLVGKSGSVALSTIEIPGEKIGWAVAEQLSSWILTNEPPEPRWQKLPCTKIHIRKSSGGQSKDLSLERAKRHLERHAVQGVTLQELANVAGYTEKTLREKFLRHYGIKISEHIRKLRLDEALLLLKTTKEDIHTIASRCGFSSASNFFNFIQRQTGKGPAEIRDALQKE